MDYLDNLSLSDEDLVAEARYEYEREEAQLKFLEEREKNK